MRTSFMALFGLCMTWSALAQGFLLDDLTTIEKQARAALGPDYVARAQPQRVTLLCVACPGRPAIDILLGRQTDGTEARVRAGQTTIAQLEAQCQARDPSCRLERADFGPAVGWLSSWRLGTMFVSTLVLLRDGDLLTVRSTASDPELARANMRRLMTDTVPQIAGP